MDARYGQTRSRYCFLCLGGVEPSTALASRVVEGRPNASRKAFQLLAPSLRCGLRTTSSHRWRRHHLLTERLLKPRSNLDIDLKALP